MNSAALSQAYRSARERAGLILRERGLIVVSGRERASYLQGLLTNDTVALGAGQGCYAAYLTPQGRMITDLFVYELGDVILLAMPRSTKDTVLSRLDQFIFSEDVQLGDVTDTFASAVVVGPHAGMAVSTALSMSAAELDAMPLHGNARLPSVANNPVIVLRVADTGAPGFELVIAREQMPALLGRLHDAGVVDVDQDTADVLRVEAGVPVFGRDMDEDTIPLEAGIEQQAISFTKGCYVGQEVIIRVLHRGHGRVARRLVGLRFETRDVPQAGTALSADGKEIGTITSSAISPALDRAIALGYVKRDFAAPGTSVTTASGAPAEVVALPFLPS